MVRWERAYGPAEGELAVRRNGPTAVEMKWVIGREKGVLKPRKPFIIRTFASLINLLLTTLFQTKK